MASQLNAPRSRTSRIPNFFRLSVAERIQALADNGLLDEEDIHLLRSARHQLELSVADKMIENVVGVFGLPMGIALNFKINQLDYVVPLVVEEPSIVAGLSGAARMAAQAGGYEFTTTDPILIGQVQVVLDGEPQAAVDALQAHHDELLAEADRFMPNMVARGGGARDIEVFHYRAEQDGRHMVVLHVLIDTRDAMGANLVNTVCEGLAPTVERLTGGKVFLRILSNLTDRATVHAQVHLPVEHLAGKGFTGEQVRDGIILANDLAVADPYRAATHNKGIMNGVDAVAIATGNDWRAIEAAAHAYAARSGRYQALTKWYKNQAGDLVGEIDIPMKVGTVGGSLETNPSVKINHRLLGSPSATELAGVMGTIGLAQNFAALRALSTNGIQQNHMNLHARSVASTAGVPEAYFDRVVEALIDSGEIKVWKAQQLVEALSGGGANSDEKTYHASCGKIILLGEHAVVYGRPAIALPIPLAVEACVELVGERPVVKIDSWGIEQDIEPQAPGVGGMLAGILESFGLMQQPMLIEVIPHVPRAMGLGGSSAFAVAILRALNHTFDLGLNDDRINALAFECEKVAHGTPSGVDNTVATYGTPLLYEKPGEQPTFEQLTLSQPLELVVGITGEESLTAVTVANVRAAWQHNPQRHDLIFDQIETVTRQGIEALKQGDYAELGQLMNHCQGYLNALQLSTPELEELIYIARQNGALGAKLTGGGGGGSMVALCPGCQEQVQAAMQAAGYDALTITL